MARAVVSWGITENKKRRRQNENSKGRDSQKINEVLRETKAMNGTAFDAGVGMAMELLDSVDAVMAFTARDGQNMFPDFFWWVVEDIEAAYNDGVLIATVLFEIDLNGHLPHFRATGFDVAGGSHILEDVDYNEEA